MVHDLSEGHSLANQFIAEIRDADIQKDRLRFRRNMERIGEIFAYEISKELPYHSKEIQTPVDQAKSKVIAEQPVLGTILRAGLALHNGLLNYFDEADNAFISAYRKHNDQGGFEIELEYVTCPALNERTLIISDPMLATGQSMVHTINELLKIGHPGRIYIVSAIAAWPGIQHVQNNLSNISIWCGAIDDKLTKEAFIDPGLGDAGDLAFGKKVQD
ncbi:MAG: uracil phosphoribosyltransferase [Bacteroidetes bacterium SW_11_45_7]|nr:MAG: uracil phosphoribosyltransferase [Bacteroidetes bacterium SW_11_45_7]